jgi:hypothetical protein
MGGCDAPSRLLLCPARPESATALPGAGNPGNAGRSFVVQHDVAPSGSLQSRSLTLRGDGVTVDFGFDAASPRISLTRYW